jgi:hypothetical protein
MLELLVEFKTELASNRSVVAVILSGKLPIYGFTLTPASSSECDVIWEIADSATGLVIGDCCADLIISICISISHLNKIFYLVDNPVSK